MAAAYLGQRDDLDQIGREELSRRLEDGDLMVIDVRPEPEFRAGHTTGARSVPIGDLARRLDDLPADVEIVAYCRGRFCVYADEAVRLLRSRGRSARRLEGGFPEWRRSGLPASAGPPGDQLTSAERT